MEARATAHVNSRSLATRLVQCRRKTRRQTSSATKATLLTPRRSARRYDVRPCVLALGRTRHCPCAAVMLLPNHDLLGRVDPVNLNTFLAISKPMVAICMSIAPRCNSLATIPLGEFTRERAPSTTSQTDSCTATKNVLFDHSRRTASPSAIDFYSRRTFLTRTHQCLDPIRYQPLPRVIRRMGARDFKPISNAHRRPHSRALALASWCLG